MTRMSSSFSKTFFFFFHIIFVPTIATISWRDDFTFNGFSNANLSLDGIASVTPTGLLQLTNQTQNMTGHSFYPTPLHFKPAAPGTKTLSFSTTFAFAMLSELSDLSGQGLALFVSPTPYLPLSSPSQYLGLFTETNNGNSSNRVFAVEFDTIQNPEFHDINDNHVGIDINGLHSNSSYPAGYYEDGTGLFKNLTLISGQPMQAWIDFDEMQLNVTVSLLHMPKPTRPLLSSTLDLASVMLDSMYVGFSSSDGPFHTRHYILGWSFKMNGVASPLDYAKLPSLPVTKIKRNPAVLAAWLATASCLIVLLAVTVAVCIVKRRFKYAELLEDWELDYGPHRFSYKDLFEATKGFKDKDLLGTGGFGRVYRGVLPASKAEIAVKKVSHESRQGMREFVAEVVSIGHLRHRNLVPLLGYCRRKGELLLVYEFMPNGSLDKHLHDQKMPTLSWAQRFRIIKGVASGILYLHEYWEMVVLHRDIKPSNVLLDGELNARIGDFGLARLYDRCADPRTTRVVGTMGYLAPELSMTGKATTMTDVFAFGVCVLEVVCGRRPIEPCAETDEDVILVEWVLEGWKRGLVLEDIMDQRLKEEECCSHEVELALKLGLLCSHPVPTARPSMRQVVQILDGDAELPELCPYSLSFSSLSLYQNLGFDNYIISLTSSSP